MARSLPAAQSATTRLAPVPGRVNHSEHAHHVLRDAINTGQMVAGQIYSVQALADQLRVSRTPVREALLQLARQGLVQPVRNRGFVVVETSIQDIHDIFQMRLLLEPAAARITAGRLGDADLLRLRDDYRAMVAAARAGDSERMWRHDRHFHLVIMETSGNARLSAYVESLRDFVQTRGKLTTRTRHLLAIAREHEPVLAALEKRDGVAAASAIRRHITATRKALVAQESRPAGHADQAP